MLAFGICIGTEAKYQSFALPGLTTYAVGATRLERRGQDSIFTAYNSILDEACKISDLSGLVLLHEDVELRASLDNTLTSEFADPSVAIVGAIGGRGVRSISWGQCAERFGRAPDSYYGDNDMGGGYHDVDIVDGLLLALSPWAVANLRFDDQTFRGFHAYDADICMQARAAGRRVRVAEIELYHHTKGGFGDVANHRASDDAFRAKWGLARGSMPYRLRQRLRGQPY